MKSTRPAKPSNLEKPIWSQQLTERQHRALSYIYVIAGQQGSPPTLRELCEHMGYSAIGSAQDMILSLRKKGFLETPQKQSARHFLLTEQARALFSDHSARSSSPQLPNNVISIPSPVIAIPFLGKVAAGLPIEAIEQVDEFFSLAIDILPKSHKKDARNLFALQTKGDSMIDAGIFEDDVLIVKTATQANLNEIVVARVQQDATVKRLMKDKRGFYLKPENKNFHPIYAVDQPFDIAGVVIALIRQF